MSERDEKGQFKEGFSGNPKGRPPKKQSLTELAEEYLLRVDDKEKVVNKELFIKKVFDQAMSGDTTCQKLIWNYIDGMPTQKVLTSDLDKLKDIPLNELIAAINDRPGDGSDQENSS